MADLLIVVGTEKEVDVFAHNSEDATPGQPILLFTSFLLSSLLLLTTLSFILSISPLSLLCLSSISPLSLL
jgi:hypothetical protein